MRSSFPVKVELLLGCRRESGFRIPLGSEMNNYHVYDAIGQGKHSTVYKGRKKKTIEYFAIKSVEKSQRSRVLHEVKMLNSLDHPNILKFHAWYEASAHLWLVLEYCVGGDLLTLLKQDSQLPEESIHDLARGLVEALQYLHSKGTIYCDLKPSSILLDENGHTKLCDFGLAKRLTDIEKIDPSTSKRGTPSYMAPELFRDGGVHSFASDFWSLGCILYELYTGKPPFLAKDSAQLAKSSQSDPTPPLLGKPTSSFERLVSSLLAKDPAKRLQWPELCEHDFWNMKIAALPLPSQPAFGDMLHSFSRLNVSRGGHNGSSSELKKTPPRQASSAKMLLPRRNGDTECAPVQRTPPRHATSRPNFLKRNGGNGTPAQRTPSKNGPSNARGENAPPGGRVRGRGAKIFGFGAP